MNIQINLLLATIMLSSSLTSTADDTITTRVVGGSDSVEGDWPWMVNVSAGRSQCGGTLIDARTVMTAAHCIYSNGIEISAARISVNVGAYNLLESSETIDITQTYIHHSYDPTNSASSNDIALLRLITPVSNVSLLETADITTTSEAVSSQSDVIILGWGSTVGYAPDEQVTPIYPDILQEVALPLQTDAECRQNTGSSYDAATMVCAGDQNGGEDSCQGDSGGPLILNNGGSWQQIGIVSWGSGCASAGHPGVYTRTAVYEEWIDNFLNGIAIHNKLTYGTTNIGENEQLNLLISNNTASEVELTFSLSGSNEFTYDRATCAIIAADSICSLPIIYTPTTLTESNATLTVQSDTVNLKTVSTALSGNLGFSSTSGGGGGSLFFAFSLPFLLLRRFVVAKAVT
ncbi:hypothetical protein GCM10007916_26920 [Psychromonas marina]|uniref:Peptidase S1 domain-containing protein n=1 Tax=Psychromonas marina TaxID=88364 RepID=A0ABQ6E2I3_9GAMM|nr:trypsin-like serine protease [Psychromonas marina]GLS91623.1 hypothetical protein GCM10007916_26920 [Psychromonas marina]